MIYLAMALKYHKAIIIGLLMNLCITLSLMLRATENKLVLAEAKHELEIKTMQNDSLQAAIEERQKAVKEIQDVVKKSEARQEAMVASYDGTVVINDSLSDTIKNIETSLITANRSATIDYAKSVNGLFTECTSQYLEMAKSAAREQEEARRLREAWQK